MRHSNPLRKQLADLSRKGVERHPALAYPLRSALAEAAMILPHNQRIDAAGYCLDRPLVVPAGGTVRSSGAADPTDSIIFID